ncbi:hypothetical protein D9M71_641080 [compost metagenome]
MALVGKAQGHGHFGRRLALGEQAPRPGQAQLDQVSMRCNAERGLERAGQAKAVDAAGLGQVFQADIALQVGMQVVPRALRGQWQARVRVDAPAPVQVAGQAGEQVVHGRLPHDAQILVMHGPEGEGGGTRQALVVAQGIGKAGQAVAWRVLEQRPQLLLQPGGLQVQR